MVSARQGVIVNVSSGAADLVPISSESDESVGAGRGDRYAYAASKAALNRLGNAVASEFRAAGIAVMNVCPGNTRTELVELMLKAGTAEGSPGPIDVPVKTVLHMITCEDPMRYSGGFFKAEEFAREQGLL
jgi:NAD(P)-dependent dehydrogenase (short-subunit alcohol dehydrogenase family)